jgi:hypothetical protein
VEREHEVSQPPWPPIAPGEVHVVPRSHLHLWLTVFNFFKPKKKKKKKKVKRNSADGSGGGRTRGKSAQASACSRNGRIHKEQKNRCVVPWVRSAGARQRTADERGGASKEST